MFPIKAYFPFFGGLHIEQALLRIHGQLIKGSGIDDIIGMAGLPTAGLQTTVCDVNCEKYKKKLGIHYKLLRLAY